MAEKNEAKLGDCSIIVLDEADKLLSKDFQIPVEKLLTFLPEKRQILLLSATYPVMVKEFKEKYMQGCSLINLMEELTLKGVT